MSNFFLRSLYLEFGNIAAKGLKKRKCRKRNKDLNCISDKSRGSIVLSRGNSFLKDEIKNNLTFNIEPIQEKCSKKSKKEESTMTSSSPAKSSFQCGRFKYNSDKVPQISPFSTSAIQEFPPAQGDPASYAYIKKKFSRIPQFSPVALSKQRVLEIKSFDKNKEDREIQKDKFIDAQQRQIAIDKWVKKHRRNSNKKKRMHTRNRNRISMMSCSIVNLKDSYAPVTIL